MRTLAELPGPKGLPLVGNLLQIDLKKLHRVLSDWCDQYGSLYVFHLGPRPILVVSDPEQMQLVLKNRPKLYRRLGTIEPVFKEIGITGVFSAEGEDWKRQRRLTAHALDANHLRQFFPTLVKVTERLRNRWLKAAEQGTDVDIQQDLMRYTVDVTTNLAFGYDMNTLETEGDIIQEHLELIFPAINRRINSPFPYWRYFKLPGDRALDQALLAVRDTINGFVTRGRARMAENPDLAAHPTNLLEAMLGARDEGDAAFTDEEIYGNVLTMLLAGEDTTANTLAWMAHFMVEQPEAQRRMQIDADSVLGESKIPASVGEADRLQYIEAVTHETMRLKPVAPILFFETIEAATIGDVSLPAGSAVFLITMHAAQQDAHFTGAADFRPERWLASDTQAQARPGQNTKAFLPFGGGPRYCPGRQLAMLEIKMVMAMLCSTFEVLKSDRPEPVGELFSFTMMPQNLFVRFKKRRSAA